MQSAKTTHTVSLEAVRMRRLVVLASLRVPEETHTLTQTATLDDNFLSCQGTARASPAQTHTPTDRFKTSRPPNQIRASRTVQVQARRLSTKKGHPVESVS
ncbi:hypothetical protein [Phaffia rhodozyma]|uniref:Uncharacterized protein n=1 Tax=Phaffia rhodozyma TaxID=264483 RepID=A0A0F7SI75_PHARH|nr:hypothetical protein [Phaffia rhodozyma]